MRTRILLLIFSLCWSVAAFAQPVTVIGPITPGDCPQFSSNTIIKDSGFNCSGAPGGAAGGVLSGTYPNPGFSTSAVSSMPWTQAGTGAVARTVDAKLKEGALSIKDFGAACDGVTDDSNAITTADAAAAAGGKALYFPAGTCLAQGLNPRRSNLEWFGDGPYLSIIKAVNPGIGFDTLVWFGERTATSQYQNIYVHDLGFNGNSTGTNAVVEVRNITLSNFKSLQITGGGADGLRSDTSTTTINTNLLRNHYINIESYVNAGIGFHFLGEKDSEFTSLFSHNNTGSSGFYWGPANLNSSALCETTENYGASISSRDNTGDGIVFDEVEKFPISSLQSSINGGYGIRFMSTFTGCTSTGSNSVNIANATLRNNSLGGIRAADSGYVYGAQFGNVWIRGDNSNVNAVGIRLDGVQSTQFGNVDIQAEPGQAILIEQGTPLGSTTQSANIHFGSIILLNNGNVGATLNHGLSIQNSSIGIVAGSLVAADSHTSGANFEINLASTAAFIASSATLTASGGAGNNINATAGSVLQLTKYNGILNSGPNSTCNGANTVFNSSQTCTTPVSGTLMQEIASGVSNVHELEAYGNGVANDIWGRAASGTAASPGVTASGQFIWQLVGQGYDANPNWASGLAAINIVAAEAFSSGHNGSKITFQTVPIASTTAAVGLTLQPSGGASVGTSTDPGIGAILANTSIKSQGPTSGVGYGAGAGGAVTQLTSRTTGVTLNNVTGAITLFTAAGSTTPATFTVTNSSVAATDTISVSQKSGTNLYEIFVTAVAAGSFNVTFFTTGGTASDAPVLNFNVIKGSAN